MSWLKILHKTFVAQVFAPSWFLQILLGGVVCIGLALPAEAYSIRIEGAHIMLNGPLRGAESEESFQNLKDFYLKLYGMPEQQRPKSILFELESIGGRVDVFEQIVDIIDVIEQLTSFDGEYIEVVTYVRKRCISGCAYLFSVGSRRIITEDAELVLHHARDTDTQEPIVDTSERLLKQYIEPVDPLLANQARLAMSKYSNTFRFEVKGTQFFYNIATVGNEPPNLESDRKHHFEYPENAPRLVTRVIREFPKENLDTFKNFFKNIAQ